jgi:hypothetical protein
VTHSFHESALQSEVRSGALNDLVADSPCALSTYSALEEF